MDAVKFEENRDVLLACGPEAVEDLPYRGVLPADQCGGEPGPVAVELAAELIGGGEQVALKRPSVGWDELCIDMGCQVGD